MISTAAFRDLALSMPDARQGSHFDLTDFRVRSKIFATLRERDGRAMVKLTPDQQRLALETMPELVAPVPGGWGEKGATLLNLAACDEAAVRHLLVLAHGNAAAKTGRKKPTAGV